MSRAKLRLIQESLRTLAVYQKGFQWQTQVVHYACRAG